MSPCTCDRFFNFQITCRTIYAHNSSSFIFACSDTGRCRFVSRHEVKLTLPVVFLRGNDQNDPNDQKWNCIIRKYLDKESTEKLVHAFVSSQFDCGNSMLFGLPEFQLAKLQSLHTAACLDTLTKRQEHISPTLYDLHWLPVKSRILYRILLITFKALNGLVPTYIHDLAVTKDPVHSLRSNAAPKLHHQSVNTVTYGQRVFT